MKRGIIICFPFIPVIRSARFPRAWNAVFVKRRKLWPLGYVRDEPK